MTPKPIADLAAEALRDVLENGSRAEKIAVLRYALPQVGNVAADDAGQRPASVHLTFAVDENGAVSEEPTVSDARTQ